MTAAMHIRTQMSELALSPDWRKLGALIRAIDAAPSGIDSTLWPEALEAVEVGARKLSNPTGRDSEFNIGVELFAVPQCLARYPYKLRDDVYWRSKQLLLESRLTPDADDRTLSFSIAALLICDSIRGPADEALGALIDRIGTKGPSRFMAGLIADAEGFRSLLINNGWLAPSPAPVRRALEAFAARLANLSGVEIRAWTGAVIKLFFSHVMPAWILDEVFTGAVVPILKRAADARDNDLIDVVVELENRIQTTYLKAVESATRFNTAHAALSPILYKIGQATRTAIGPMRDACFTASPSRPTRVAFFLHTAAVLAHTTNLFTFLRGLSHLTPRPIEPFIYVLESGLNIPEPMAAYHGSLATVRWPETRPRHPVVWIREVAERDGVAAVVFVSIPVFLSFAAGFGVAPALVWWAMKYHGLQSPGIDGYLTVGNFFDDELIIDGRQWRSSRMALPPLTGPDAEAQGASIRKKLDIKAGDVLLGCIGREEKLLDIRFMDALAEVLRQRPEARFMWTGRKLRVAQVRDLMAARGILDRCPFVGWLADTQAGAAAIDIFLDSFPFASGHTAYEAMAAGKPVLVLRTSEAIETSTATSLVPLFERAIGRQEDQDAVRAMFTDTDGSSLLPFPATIEDYVAMAVRLIKDVGFRSRVGSACRSYVERYARDEETCAQTTCRHLIEIVQDKVAAHGGTIIY